MLELFDGQLSLTDIYNSTYKELGYLRKHRVALKKAKAKSRDELQSALDKMS